MDYYYWILDFFLKGDAETFNYSPDLGQERLLVAILNALQITQRHILEIGLRTIPFSEKIRMKLKESD